MKSTHKDMQLKVNPPLKNVGQIDPPPLNHRPGYDVQNVTCQVEHRLAQLGCKISVVYIYNAVVSNV